MMSGKPWVAHIEEEIGSLVDLDVGDGGVRCSIFRVPPPVRRAKPDLYSPQIIPFGLYGIERIRNEKMSPIDRLKLQVASVILKIIKAPYTECYQHYDAAVHCLNLPRITPIQLYPVLSDLLSSLSRLRYVSRDSVGKLEMMRGRIAGLKAMAHAPGYELREREARLLAADLDSCFKVFEGFLDANSSENVVNQRNWKWLCDKVVGDVTIMDLYDDVSDMHEEAARSLLTLDAIFLVGFMLSLHGGSSPESRIQIEELGWFNPVLEVFLQEGVRCNIDVIAFDMWLMENQIPLPMIRSALECIWEVSNPAGSAADAGKVLGVLVKHAVKRVLHFVPGDCSKHSSSIDAIPISESKHLLECLYRVVCPSVRTTSSSCREQASRRQHRVNKSTTAATKPSALSRASDAIRKTKKTYRSRSSSTLEAEVTPPSSSNPSQANGSRDNPILTSTPSHPLPTYPLFLPGYSSINPQKNALSFGGFSFSAPADSPGERDSSYAASGNNQFHQSLSPLEPPPQLRTSSTQLLGLLGDGEQHKVDHRYGKTNGHHKPTAAAVSTDWNDSHSSPVTTDDELETPFRSFRRSSSPLPVSDTMNMEDDELNHVEHVEHTLTGSRSRNNSYSTVTIDIPQIHVAKLRPGAQSNFPIPDGSAPFFNKLRCASMGTVRSFQSAGHWVGAPWRLFRKMFARRYERKISFGHGGMYGSKGAASFRDRDFMGASKPAVGTCPMSEVRILPVPTATQLRKAGIRFRSGSQVGCKPLLGEGEGFGVFRPTLFLPKLLVDENTERILQNLVAFELVSASEHELMSFLHFMNDLVKTEEDVLMLRQGPKAVLWHTSPLNDFQVVSMFNNLLQKCHFTETNRSRDLRKELTSCYSRSWRYSFHLVMGTVCSRSWILVSLVAATLMMVALQTVYVLLGFYGMIHKN